MNELYTCKECGCHEFIVEHIYTEETVIEEVLDCSCEDPKDECAAVFQNKLIREMIEQGNLDEDHRVEDWEEAEELNRWTETDEDPEINCSECFEDASDSDWREGEEFEPEIVDEEFYVRCSKCEREIEFGWSHLEGGRIWTVEDKDFNPWKSFPEKRYIEKWEKRGWLRPPNRRLKCKSCGKEFMSNEGGESIYKDHKIYCKCGYCFGDIYDESIGK